MTAQTSSSMFADENLTEFQVAIRNSEPPEQASRLKAAIKRAGGNAVVAQRAGLSVSTLNNYVAGRDMKTSFMVALAKACGVNIAWLACGEGPMTGELQAQHQAMSEPQKTAPERPAKAFATIKVDLMAQALEIARKTFEDAGAVPEPRELVQVMLLVYDGINKS